MSIVAAALATGQSGAQKSPAPQSLKPDLIPILHHPMDGQVTVKNIGNAPAGPSKLTLDCIKVSATHNGACPDLPPSAAATYFDPAFPKNATIQVPALAPGETFTHSLAFWNEFKWTSGNYKFVAVADAGRAGSQRKKENKTQHPQLPLP